MKIIDLTLDLSISWEANMLMMRYIGNAFEMFFSASPWRLQAQLLQLGLSLMCGLLRLDQTLP